MDERGGTTLITCDVFTCFTSLASLQDQLSVLRNEVGLNWCVTLSLIPLSRFPTEGQFERPGTEHINTLRETERQRDREIER